MFTVPDQDTALDFCMGKLGWEVRADVRFGADRESRWLEVAPPGLVARARRSTTDGRHAGWPPKWA